MENYQINKTYKHIKDQIYEYIFISDICMEIIDTMTFQRLRKLRQLSGVCFVYQNANHTRFDHSIGTSHLAERLLLRIKSVIEDPCYEQKDTIRGYLSSIKELQPYYARYSSHPYTIDEYVIELVKIASLCHDLGHGMFSHLFDDGYLQELEKDEIIGDKIKNHPLRHHEMRSIVLLRKIVCESERLSAFLDINPFTNHSPQLQFIIDIIHPREENTGFLYQIVSNYLTGIDVDKFDYLTRDSYLMKIPTGFTYDRLIDYINIIDTHICYQEQCRQDIIDMFEGRYKFHKCVYSHKSVISVQMMIVDIMKLLGKIMHYEDSLDNLDFFCQLTDEYILDSYKWMLIPSIFHMFSEEQQSYILQANHLIQRLYEHDLYSNIGTYIGNDYLRVPLYDENTVLYTNRIGYITGTSDPFSKVLLYSTKNRSYSFPFTIGNYTQIYSKRHNEALTIMFNKEWRGKTNEEKKQYEMKMNILRYLFQMEVDTIDK